MSFLEGLWGRVQTKMQADPRFSEQFKGQLAGAQNPFGMKRGGFNPFQLAGGGLPPFAGQVAESFRQNPNNPIAAVRPFMAGQGNPLASLMAGLQGRPSWSAPSGGAGVQGQPSWSAPAPPMDLAAINDEYERIKAAQGVGAARAWQRQQMG